MRISLFSQSLFALSLDEAIEATARAGYDAIELACAPPHLGPEAAAHDAARVAARIRDRGLRVSCLSLFTRFTDPDTAASQVDAARRYIELAPLFATDMVKVTPGPPACADATDAHWNCLVQATEKLTDTAAATGVRLAYETHMRQLTDTLAGALRLLQRVPSPRVGLTVDFSNLSFAGEQLEDALPQLIGRMYNAHVKNGTVGADGAWHFGPLDTGLTDYARVLPLVRELGYDGWLAVECLGPDAAAEPEQTAARDLALLRAALERS